MDNKQFAQFQKDVKTALDAREKKHNLSGEFVTITSVTPQDKYLLPQHRHMGLYKVQRFQAQHLSKNYNDYVNTSTGVADIGGEVVKKRDSYYESESMEGLFSHLKSNPDKKYIQVKWRNEGQIPHNGVLQEIYITKNGKYIDNPYDYMKNRPDYKHEVTLPDGSTTRVEAATEIRMFKAENIIEMRVAGVKIVDDSLGILKVVLNDVL